MQTLKLALCSAFEKMSDESTKSTLEMIARVFKLHSVEYLVIGGQAEFLFGGNRPTFDVDLCYRRTAENFARLAAALRGLNPTLRGAPPDLPFQLDARSIALGSNFTFRTSVGDLDLLGHVEPLGDYDTLLRNAEKYQLGDLSVQTIGLDDLIQVKAHIRRQKDQESLRQLLLIKKLREEQRE